MDRYLTLFEHGKMGDKRYRFKKKKVKKAEKWLCFGIHKQLRTINKEGLSGVIFFFKGLELNYIFL